MSTTSVHSDGAPKAIGPYSQAISANGFLFTAGQIALDPVSAFVAALVVFHRLATGLPAGDAWLYPFVF